jgi:hypothetical protein
MALLNINPAEFQNIEAPREYTILPVGEYQMQIVQSEIRPTKAGTGNYLWLEFDILKGPAPQGQNKFWQRLNFDNPNETARRIANQALLALSVATGHTSPVADSEQLHFKPVKVVIKHAENKQGNLEAKPSFYPVNASAPSAPAAAPAAPATAAPSGAKPWERHKK